jgi:hypothetical protein
VTRPDYCPLWNEPCQKGCEPKCGTAGAWEKLRKENERLRGLCDDLYSDILAAASLAPKDSGAYSLLHETIRHRRDRWAKTPNAKLTGPQGR